MEAVFKTVRLKFTQIQNKFEQAAIRNIKIISQYKESFIRIIIYAAIAINSAEYSELKSLSNYSLF
jgi:hypothetical protein